MKKNDLRKKKRVGSILRCLAALVLAFTVVTADLAPAAAVTWADVNDLKNEAGDLADQRKELESQLSALADDKSEALKRKNLLDQQISNLSSQISNVEKQISTYEALITQTEAELAEAQEKEEAQYELFCSRVRDMGEAGDRQLLVGALPGNQLHGSAEPSGTQRDHGRRSGGHR